MRKASKLEKFTVVNWTLPAFQSSTGFKTCPNAALCAVGCYARSGTYRFSGSIKAHEEKLALSQSENFTSAMIQEIENWLSKKSVSELKVRIHDAGDFYSLDYFKKWISVIEYFKSNDSVTFYAYSKQVKMIKQYGELPKSFRVIFSYGGKQDALIDIENDFHSKVFESESDLKANKYENSTENDLVAATSNNVKIGLIYHGAKSFKNTQWQKVGVA